VTALQVYSDPLDDADYARVAQKEKNLQDELSKGKGGISIATYPTSPYLTQLVVRVLRRREKLVPALEQMVGEAAWTQLTRQLALVQATGKTLDAFALAYLLMLVTAVTPISKISPVQVSIQRAALKTVFDCQLQDGTWPLSRPLFHYPNFGNAYCYEYEMLTQLLDEAELEDLLLDYLPKLSLAADSLNSSVYRVASGVQAWSSGHHPQLEGPESWTTASAHHFVHNLDRLLAEAVRRDLFRYLESPFPGPAPRGRLKEEFAQGFLDSRVKVQETEHLLRDYLWEHLVEPLGAEADRVADGRSLSKDTPRSAIFFGPPGTSKTELAKEVANFLGWPHLAIDPSHFLRNGMDGIQAEANSIFRRLEETERAVVLFDEFDELVRERGSSNAEPFSRLLTTAMLPKLARLHKRATLVFIIATNNIGEFDLAIRRRGRFDHAVQIMPPIYEAKMAKKDWGPNKLDLAAKLKGLGLAASPEVEHQIGDLTFGECEALAVEIENAPTAAAANTTLTNLWNRCTLQSPVSKEDKTTWKERCANEEQFNF